MYPSDAENRLTSRFVKVGLVEAREKFSNSEKSISDGLAPRRDGFGSNSGVFRKARKTVSNRKKSNQSYDIKVNGNCIKYEKALCTESINPHVTVIIVLKKFDQNTSI